MDPRLMKLLGIVPMAQSEGDEGEGGGVAGRQAEDVDEGEGEDEVEETEDDDTDEDEDGEDEGDAEEEADEDEGEGDDDDEDGDDALGERAQKRIRKLIAGRKDAEARVKALEKQLDEAKKLSGDDGKAIMKAAERCGILPGLMSKTEAKAFEEIDDMDKVIAGYETWLDDHDPEDAFKVDEDHSLSYAKVERRVRRLKEELGDLKAEYGGRRKELEEKVRKIFEAGVEALKGGKKPVKEEKTTAKKKLETRPKANSPKPNREGRGGADDMEVDDEDSLEAFIMADRKKNRK